MASRAKHKLHADQLAQATSQETGTVDLKKLLALVLASYEEFDRDLVQSGRSMSFMVDEFGTTHRRVLDAIDAVPASISLFDLDDRFVLWNKTYAEQCREFGMELVVGMHFGEVLRGAIAAGFIPHAEGREEEWIAQRLAARRSAAH